MIASIGIVFKICIQKIGEKEDFQDNKHYEKFNQDDRPYQFPPFRHVGKSFSIEPEYSV